jgi:hypothetical protein
MEGGSADNARRIYLPRGAQKVKNIEPKKSKNCNSSYQSYLKIHFSKISGQNNPLIFAISY